MKIGKALHMAGLVFAVIVLVAPAAAHGKEWWWFDHEEETFPLASAKKSVAPAFYELRLTNKAGEVTLGPCEGGQIGMLGELYSKFGGMGEGSLTKNNTSPYKECPTNNLGTECTVKKLEPTGFGSPWAITLKSSTQVTITNFSMTIETNGKCGLFPKESTTPAATVEGKFINYKKEGGGSRVLFESAGPLKVEGIELFLDGYLQFGTQFTAITEPTAFWATTNPAIIHGKQAETIVVSRSGRSVECKEVLLSAKAESEAKTLTVTPSYFSCSTILGPATVKMNGCDYLLHLKSELVEGETYKYKATTDLKCPAGKEVEVEVYTSATSHTEGKPACRYAYGETGNQGLGTIQLTNKSHEGLEDKSWIQADLEVKGMTSKRTAGTTILCGAENDSSGTLNGKMQITAETEGKEPNGIAVFPE
jgi:hypothetical protein